MTTDPFDTAAAEIETASKAAKVKAIDMTEEADWKWFLSSPRGRRIVREMLEVCGVHRTSFTGDTTTFFNEGQRQVGLIITDKVCRFAPDQYVPMLREKRSND